MSIRDLWNKVTGGGDDYRDSEEYYDSLRNLSKEEAKAYFQEKELDVRNKIVMQKLYESNSLSDADKRAYEKHLSKESERIERQERAHQNDRNQERARIRDDVPAPTKREWRLNDEGMMTYEEAPGTKPEPEQPKTGEWFLDDDGLMKQR